MSAESIVKPITQLSYIVDPLGLGPKKIEEQKKAAKKAAEIKQDTASDAADFEKFKEQEASLLDTASQPIFNPKYKRASAGLKKQTEALAQIFNARKQEALQRKAAPGISQTRMM